MGIALPGPRDLFAAVRDRMGLTCAASELAGRSSSLEERDLDGRSVAFVQEVTAWRRGRA